MRKKAVFSGVLSMAMPMLLNQVNAQQVNKEKSRPNIVFIFADDLCFSEMGGVGNKVVKTPNLDHLIEDGVLFTHAYNMGSWSPAICVASRTMLNTGQFVWNAQRYATNQRNLFWSDRMNSAGYDSYFTGKWHVHPRKPKKIFTNVGTVRGGMPRQTKERYERKFIEGKPDTWSPCDKSKGGYWQGGKHWSEVVADESIGFIQKASKEKKPFFMYLAFNSPHDPRQAPKKFLDMYPLDKIELPENFVERYPYEDKIGMSYINKKGQKVILRDEKLAPMPRTPYSIKKNRQEYYALITYTDYQIGRILEAIKKSGKADNTVIIFSADHGLAVGKHGFLGKQNMYDHSLRVPLILSGKGIPKDKKIDSDVYLQDAMATTLDLADANCKGVQFKSLMPLIDGKKKEQYKGIYGAYLNFQRMIRKDDWKMIMYPKAKVVRLYNMKKDPLELNDVAEKTNNKALMKSLYKEFKKLQKDTGDKLNLDVVFPELSCQK